MKKKRNSTSAAPQKNQNLQSAGKRKMSVSKRQVGIIVKSPRGSKSPRGASPRNDASKEFDRDNTQDQETIDRDINLVPGGGPDIFNQNPSKTTPPTKIDGSIYDTSIQPLKQPAHDEKGLGRQSPEGSSKMENRGIAKGLWGSITHKVLKATALNYEEQGKNKKLVGLEKLQDPEFKQLNQGLKSQKFGKSMKFNSSVNSSLLQHQSSSASPDKFGRQKTLNQSTVKKDQAEEDQDDLRTQFIDRYGVKMEIPAYYHYDAKFVPHYPDHIMTMGFHIVSKSTSNVQTTYFNKRVEDCPLKSIQSLAGVNMTNQLPESTQSDQKQANSIVLSLNKADPNGRNGFERKKSYVLQNTKKCLMAFSKSGKRFAIFNQKQRTLKVFDSTNIYTCFEKQIETDSPMFQAQIDKHDKEFTAKILEIDKHDKYVLVSSKDRVNVYLIEKNANGQPVITHRDDHNQKFSYEMKLDNYEEILDVHIDSGFDKKKFYDEVYGKEKSGQESEQKTDKLSPWNLAPFTCMVACKPQGITAVHIFDINDQQKIRYISYRKETGYLRVDISEDFRTAVMSNFQEFYVLQGLYQTNFTGGFTNKYLRYVFNHGKDQYVIASKLYDRDFDILRINDPDFHASIVRSLEPGMYEIQDAMINQQQNVMQTLIRINDTIHFDKIDMKKAELPEHPPKETVVWSCEDVMYHSYSFNWPYFAMATKDNFIFLFNAFNKNFIQRYEMPQYVTQICKTFLTDTHDFFCIVETKNQMFQIIHLDLDQNEPYIKVLEKIQYPFSYVQSKRVTGFHVRGSSHKEKINLNKKLIVIIKHEDELWGWNEGMEKGTLIKIDAKKHDGQKEDPDEAEKMDKIEGPITVQNLYYESDDNVFYSVTYSKTIGEQEIQHSDIMMIECKFGTFNVHKIYHDKDQKAEILNFGVDNTKRRLMVLSGIKNQKMKRDKIFTIYDIETETIMVRLQIFDPEIIGRLKSNLYNFVEGHIYYNNKVVKVRYDLLEQQKGGEIMENQLFDHYSDVINLGNKNKKVEMGMPLQTCLYNRLAYVIKNFAEQKPRTLMILPYLHERKIYLNRRHDSKQFYTIQQRDGQNYILCMSLNENKMYVYDEVGILQDRILYENIYKECGKPDTVSESGEYFLFSRSNSNPYNHLVKLNVDSLEVIMSVNLRERMTDHIKRKLVGMQNLLGTDLVDQVRKFKRKSTIQKKAQATTKKIAKKTGKAAKKQLHLDKEQSSSSSESDEDQDQLLDAKYLREFWMKYLEELKDLTKVKISFNLNDNGDVLVRVRPTQRQLNKVNKQLGKLKNKSDDAYDPFSDDSSVENSPSIEQDIDENLFETSSVYFFYPNDVPQDEDSEDEDDLLKDYLFFDDEKSLNKAYEEIRKNKVKEMAHIHDIQGASMNNEFIFFWNKGNVWSLNLKTHKLKLLSMYISEDDPQTEVQLVRCYTQKSKDSQKKIAIRVTQTPQKDVIILWDLKRDLEIESFDCSSEAIPFQDSQGQVYIIDKDYIINCSMACKLKCYNVNIGDIAEKARTSQFKFQFGWRVDPETHNFMIFRNYINMSFSYMTFVIKDNFDHNGAVMEDYLFDLEGYDFILGRNTLFTADSQLVSQNFDRFKFIMENYKMLDPFLLESLHYINDDPDELGGPKLAIHIALKAQNTRMVNIVLNYMTLIDHAALTSIKGIMHKLISYKAFANYMSESPFQTKQMQMKQTLQIKRRNIDENKQAILSSAYNNSSYVDDTFYEKEMKEDTTDIKNVTYAVKVQAIRADWILNDKQGNKEGIKFLRELLHQQNRDVLMTPYIQLIIQFLFEKYSSEIRQMQGVPFVLNLFSVILLIFTSEIDRTLEAGQKPAFSYNPKFYDSQDSEPHFEALHIIETIAKVLIALATFSQLINTCVQTYALRKEQIYRLWFWDDIFSIIANTSLFIIPQEEKRYARIAEMFAVIFLCIKTIYFLQLYNQIANLMNIILAVLKDTLWFLFIFFVFEISFILAYFCIGRNQMDDAIRDDGTDSDQIPPYATLIGSFDHVFTSSIGNAKTQFYYDKDMSPYIFLIFFVLAVFIKILFIKLLIAFMGNAFKTNYELRESNMKMSQLQFIVDNQHMRALSSKEKEKIVYLIAAFTVEDDKNEEQVLQHINNQIQSLQIDQKALQNNMMTEIKDMQIQQAKQMQLLYKIMKSKKIKSH